MAVTIDTNVLQVANGNSPQADASCQLACVRELIRIRSEDVVCLDRIGLILDEYCRQRFNFSGQPGVGDSFFKWLFENQGNAEHCEQVTITPRDGEGWDFEEFPTDRRLASFDRSDRKFVAVALASERKPRVLNAVDSDWRAFRVPLEENGVFVQFLCPNQA